jgi:hypothetical protein
MSRPLEGPSGFGVRALHRAGSLLLHVPRSLAWLFVLGWTAAILFVGHSRALGTGVEAWRLYLKNTGHAPLFGILALWMALCLPRGGGWPVVDSSGVRHVHAGVLVVAIADESHQVFFGGRDASLLDVLTDLTGAGCVLWILAYLAWPTVRERGLWRRLGVGVGLCALAGAAATLVPLVLSFAWL